MNPQVSVIVPIYNTKQYMDRTIKSLLAQSYNDLEIVLVDDGSTDGSDKKCDEYASVDKRIVCIHQKNKGVSSARNHGLAFAKGEFITFVDSDDFVAPNYIAELLKEMIIDPEIDISIGLNSVLELDGSLKEKKFLQATGYIKYADAMDHLFDETFFGGWVLWGKLYRRRLFTGFLFNEELSIGEDLAANLLLFSRARKIYCTGRSLYRYVMRLNSATHKFQFNKYVQFLDFLVGYIASVSKDDIMIATLLKKVFVIQFYEIILKRFFYLSLHENNFTELSHFYERFQSMFIQYLWVLNNNFIRQYVSRQCMGPFQNFVLQQQKILDSLRETHLKCYIYGAGAYAKVIHNYFYDNGILFEGFLISDGYDVGGEFKSGYPVYHVSEVQNTDQMIVFVAMNLKYANQIIHNLQAMHVPHIFLW